MKKISYIIGGSVVGIGMGIVGLAPTIYKPWGVWLVALGALIMSLPISVK